MTDGRGLRERSSVTDRSLRVEPIGRVLLGVSLVGLVVSQQLGATGPGVVLALVVIAFVIDLVAGYLLLRDPTVSAVLGRDQTTAGDEVRLRLTVERPRLPVQVRAGLDDDPVRAEGRGRVGLPTLGASRGVFRSARVLLGTSLVGAVSWEVTAWVPLDRLLYVGPVPVPDDVDLVTADAHEPDAETGARPGADGAVRSVRPYRPGDARRDVHWRTSARRDQLMVREREVSYGRVVVILVDLGDGGDAGEEAAGRASFLASVALARGDQVRLVTRDLDGTVDREVRDHSMLLRRLAAAVPGPPDLDGARPARVLRVHAGRPTEVIGA